MLMYPGLLHPIRVRIWLRTCLHEGCAQKRGLQDPFAASATFSIQLTQGTNHIDATRPSSFMSSRRPEDPILHWRNDRRNDTNKESFFFPSFSFGRGHVMEIIVLWNCGRYIKHIKTNTCKICMVFRGVCPQFHCRLVAFVLSVASL